MQYLLLPVHFLKFWYVESLLTLGRTWKNLMLYLEEDLAVTLMLRLFFVPLFHDFTIVGRALSAVFRLTRIIIGLFAFVLATIIMIGVTVVWVMLPFLLFWEVTRPYSVVWFLAGLGSFLIHTFTHPHKKIWQVTADHPWNASWINQDQLTFPKLLKSSQVQSLLQYLQLEPENLNAFSLQSSQNQDIGKVAYTLAKAAGSRYLGSVHLFIAALQLQPNIQQYLLQYDLELEDFTQALLFQEKKRQEWRFVWIWEDDFAVHHLKGINRGWLGVPTPRLDSMSVDLTRQAAEVGFKSVFAGRSEVVSEIINIFSQESKRNVILVALPGAGKSSFLHFLAKKIVSGDAPSALAIKRLVAIDPTRLLSGVKTQGDLAERVKTIFEEISHTENVILVLEEIHNLGIGEAGSEFNLYSLIFPYIESGNYQFLATTEPENYSKIIERNGTFATSFTKIELRPTTLAETLEIAEERAIQMERHGKVQVSFLALKKTVALASRLMHDRVLPDSALSILKEAETIAQNGWINQQVIEQVFSRRVHVPIAAINSDKKTQLLHLEDEIHQRLIDQEEAVRAVANALRRSAAGLREANRPIGSFLFVGPTGVGKTELAKALAEIYFQDEGAFVRFDMSEYQTQEAIDRLIGGVNESGQLTEIIHNKPYALLLLDEFEKADPKILTLFLQVLDDGRLTDGRGRTIDFTNTIIIATSNAASLTIAQGLAQGRTLEELDKQVNDELLHVFKPELVNRFDDIVLFKPLSQEDLQKIVKLKLVSLQKQLKEQGYLVEFGDDVIAQLAQKGFDPVLGARPLRRLIQDTLEADLSRQILENKLIKGQVTTVTS